MKGALVGIFLVLLAGLGLLSLHAILPCNGIWPDYPNCIAERLLRGSQETTTQAEPAPATKPDPPWDPNRPVCQVDQEHACDENGNSHPSQPANPAGSTVSCFLRDCTQDGEPVAPPDAGSSCSEGSWIKQTEGTLNASYTCADPDY